MVESTTLVLTHLDPAHAQHIGNSSRVLRIMSQNHFRQTEKSQRICQTIPAQSRLKMPSPNSFCLYLNSPDQAFQQHLPVPSANAKLHLSLCDSPQWQSRARTTAIFGAARQRDVTLRVEHGT